MDLIEINNDIQLAIAMGDADRLADLVEQRDNFNDTTEGMEVPQ